MPGWSKTRRGELGQQNAITRRHAIRLGAGFAAAAGARVLATEGRQESMTPEKLQDPKTKYPKPPFKEQSQPWPGLAGKMDPRPDHGEKSYKGSGRLAGRKALITGGDSGMVARPRSPMRAKAPTSRSIIFPMNNRTRTKSSR